MAMTYDPVQRRYVNSYGYGVGEDQNGGGVAGGIFPQTQPAKGKSPVDEALAETEAKAFSLENLQESRGAAAEDIVRQAGSEADRPTISEEDLSRMFGQVTDTSGNAFAGNIQNLGAMLGDSGWTGGSFAGGLAANIEAQRLSANRTGFSNALLKKSAADAQDRRNKYERQKDLAGIVNREPSMLGSDALQQKTGVRLAQEEIQANERAANKSAKATEKAGKSAATGSVLGGIFGAV